MVNVWAKNSLRWEHGEWVEKSVLMSSPWLEHGLWLDRISSPNLQNQTVFLSPKLSEHWLGTCGRFHTCPHDGYSQNAGALKYSKKFLLVPGLRRRGGGGQMNFISFWVILLRHFIVIVKIYQKLKKNPRFKTLEKPTMSETGCSIVVVEISNCAISYPVTSWLKAWSTLVSMVSMRPEFRGLCSESCQFTETC